MRKPCLQVIKWLITQFCILLPLHTFVSSCPWVSWDLTFIHFIHPWLIFLCHLPQLIFTNWGHCLWVHLIRALLQSLALTLPQAASSQRCYLGITNHWDRNVDWKRGSKGWKIKFEKDMREEEPHFRTELHWCCSQYTKRNFLTQGENLKKHAIYLCPFKDLFGYSCLKEVTLWLKSIPSSSSKSSGQRPPLR